MKYDVQQSTQFKLELKKLRKCNYNMSLLDEVVNVLQKGEPLPPKYKDHALKGNWKGYRECHISPDWLLIYRYEENVLNFSFTTNGYTFGFILNDFEKPIS